VGDLKKDFAAARSSAIASLQVCNPFGEMNRRWSVRTIIPVIFRR
jgi:hypothetical protein